MASLNKVTLIGRLGRDPEVRSFSNGGKIVKLRGATSESWRDKSTGERKEKTEWHSVSVSAEHSAKYAEQYLRKGSMVYIEGQLETRKWQAQDGTDRYSTEIAVRQYGGQLQGLDGRQDSEGGGRGRDEDDRRSEGSSGGSGYGGGGRPSNGGGGAGRRDIDDEIPFAPEWRG